MLYKHLYLYLKPLCYGMALGVLVFVAIGCGSKGIGTDPMSLGIPGESGQPAPGRQGAVGSPTSGGGQFSTCDCENGMARLDPGTYIDPANPRLLGLINAEALDQMAAAVRGMDEYGPAETINFSSYAPEPIPKPGCEIDPMANSIHWQIVDFGWGIVPGQVVPEVSTDGVNWTMHNPDDIRVEYFVNYDVKARLAVNYEFIFVPQGLTPLTTYYFRLRIPGLIGLYGDSDSDGLPDPAELSTDPNVPDTDGDGLIDSIDPCPTVADSDGDGIPDGLDPDIDGDGGPDPPLVSTGYGTWIYSDTVEVGTSDGDLPEITMAGFPIDLAYVETRTTLHLWLDECVPTELMPDVLNPNNWVAVLTSLPPSYPPVPSTMMPVAIVPSGTGADELDTIWPIAIPDGVEMAVMCTVRAVSMSCVISTAIQIIINPTCTCPTISASPRAWNCCGPSWIDVEIICGSCPYQLIVTETVTYYTKDSKTDNCQDQQSTATSGTIGPVSFNVTPFVWPLDWQCQAYGKINVSLPFWRCADWKLDFELRCYDWHGNYKSSSYATADTATAKQADIAGPELVHWEYIDDIPPFCSTEVRFRARDDCLLPWYRIDIYYSSGFHYIFYDLWHPCYDAGNPHDTNAPGGGPPPCDEGCAYFPVVNCYWCRVDCVQFTAYDTCGNWSTVSLGPDELPIPDTVSFTGKPGDPGVGNGTCADSDTATWRQYVNLKKRFPDIAGPVCPGQNILPAENENWMVLEVQLDPPYPGVEVVWHQFDPYHREAPPGAQNTWNESPNPLWDYWKTHTHPRWGGPVNPNCWDPDQWDKGHDNHNWIYLPFRNECDWSIITNISTTDCEGKARIRYITSPYGGDNHIVIADPCNTRMYGNCADPTVSETIEVWRYAELYRSEMAGGIPTAGTPPIVLDIHGSCAPPGCTATPYASDTTACNLDTSLVLPIFEDCFAEVKILDGIESVPYQHQNSLVSCVDDVNWTTGAPLSNWHSTNPPNYQVQEFGADYYCYECFIPMCDPATGPHVFSPHNICPTQNTGCITGMACPVLCDHQHAKVWIGLIKDWVTVSYVGKPPYFGNNAADEIKYTCAHELGHQIGGLWPGWYHVDTGPSMNPRDPTDPYGLKVYREFSYSIMFYTYAAPWFNVPMVHAVRGGLNGCLSE